MALEESIQRPDGSTLRRCTTREFLDSCPPRISEIFHYWDSLRDGRKMPRRAAFRPELMIHHLPGILLIDVEGIGADGVGIFRYRVVGTEEVRLRGHDPTGKLVQEGFFWSSLEEAVMGYESIRKSGSYLYETAEFISPEGRWRSEHGIMLPFSEDGAAVSQILVYSMARSSRDY
ncbi:MAG: PAS domain-containing protein [Kiloniellaceae bacterium]